MLQTNLNVIAVGESILDTLPDGEKRSFFETLFSRIVEIHNVNRTTIWRRQNSIRKKYMATLQ